MVLFVYKTHPFYGSFGV